MASFKDYGDFDAVGLAELVRQKQRVTPTELRRRAIDRLEAIDPEINAAPIRHEDFARRQIEQGLPDGPFRGVPFLLKDLTLLAGTETHFGSRAFLHFTPDHSSTLVERHLESGADDLRQDQPAGIRPQLLDRAHRSWTDAQSLESRSFARRLLGRRGGGCRRCPHPAAGRACDRRRRIDSAFPCRLLLRSASA